MSTYLEIYTTNLTPARNALVDDISTYLSERIITPSFEIQYQKIGLDMSVKVAMAQERITKQSVGNYCSIKQDDMTYYYFITSASWTSANTVMLSISIDSINTFRDWVTFSSKTNVIREHRDRFTNVEPYAGSTMTLYRSIDSVDEGIAPALKMSLDTKITDSVAKSNQKWYLLYMTPDTPTSTSPVDCYLIPEKANIYYQKSSSAITWKATDFAIGTYYYWLRTDNGTEGYATVTTGSNSQSFSLSDYSGLVFYRTETTFDVWIVAAHTGSEVKSTTLTPLSKTFTVTTDSSVVWTQSSYMRRYSELTPDLSIIANQTKIRHSSGTSVYLANIATIDRTSSQIIKIIECPYCPIDLNFDSDYNLVVPDGFEINETSMLKLTDLNTEFSKTLDNALSLPLTITVPSMSVDAFKTYTRKEIYESKLYSSPFYTIKVTYDSFSATLPLENIVLPKTNVSTQVSIEYKQSNSITSDCGFKIDSTNKLTYVGDSDYDLYILSTRNNESPIYVNEYLNYMRTGYNYDKKNANQSIATQWISTGVSIAGAAVSIAAAVPTGGLSLVAAASMAGTAITGISNAISNQMSNAASLDQKLTQARTQATQVTGANDLDLLNWYSSNKLHVKRYRPTNDILASVGDLFYYCGYATNQHKVPDLKSRYWFNYIQCELDISDIQESPLITDFYDDIKARYSAGVTVYHRNNDEYDWDQRYENWEVGFIG